MGIGSHFNCCGKGKIDNNEFTDDDINNPNADNKVNNKDENNKNNDTKNQVQESNIVQSNNIFNKDYSFKGKSFNSTLVVAKNDSNINKGPFVPNTIEQKNTKEAIESFDKMFENLN